MLILALALLAVLPANAQFPSVQVPGTPDSPAHQLTAALAEELSQGNADGFLAHFDSEMPGYERLRRFVAALTSQDTGCSIEIVEDNGNGNRRSLSLDWALELPQGRRRATVRADIERRGERWSISLLQPLEFFDPSH